MTGHHRPVAMSLSAALGLFVGGLFLSAPTARAENQQTPDFQWNVFLDNWHVIGPFPRPNRGSSCLDVDFLTGEPKVALDKPVTWQTRPYRWTRWSGPVVDIRRALSVGDEADYHVAYAYTEFHSPKPQSATLALGHDDGARVWLNGKEVYRHDRGTAAYLDQAAVQVDLRKGTNALLVKVTQRRESWVALARLRPAGLDKPLLSFDCDYQPGSGVLHLPTLQLDLLDASGSTRQTLCASGYRVTNPTRILFTCYAPNPDPQPAKVRIRYQHPGLVRGDLTVDWAKARAGNVKIPARAEHQLTGRIVDGQSGKPIAGAQFKIAQKTYRNRSNGKGRFTLAEYNPLEPSFWAAAAGYEPKEVHVDVPSGSELAVKLKPGAQVLRGIVVDENGKPVHRAKIRPGLYGSWAPQAVTDKQGRFEIIGIPADKTRLFPTIVHPDYVPKDGFAQPLDSDKVTDASWTLRVGAVVTGRVTAKADGRPLAGIPITTGFSRFASNRVNPEAKTDAQGRYRLAGINPGAALIHAFSDHFAPSTKRVAAEVGNPNVVDFQLEPGKPVTGRLTDPKGKPVDDVWIITDTWEGVRMFRREAHSDTDGRFALTHMPSTPVEIHLIKRGYVSARDLMAVGGQHYDVTFTPIVKHTVTLRLADTKKPPQKVEIHKGYQFPGREQISWNRHSHLERDYDSRTGSYEIKESERSSARRFLRFRVPGYRDAQVPIPADATEPESFEFVLEKLDVIRGRVVTADDQRPLGGITVALINKQDRIRMDHYIEFEAGFRRLEEFTGIHAASNANGSFQLPRFEPDKQYDVLLSNKGAGFHYIPNAQAVFAQKPVELPFPEHGTIEGTVLVAGEPSPGEYVRIAWIPNAGAENDWDYPFGFGGRVQVDAKGRFRFEGLGPGRYRLCRVRAFSTPGMGGISCYLASEELVLEPGATLTHNLVQPAGHTVTGRTVDPQGKPLADGIVSVTRVTPDRERIEVVRADAEGRFTVRHLPAGRLEFSADHYTRQTGRSCGLGDRDYRAQTTADVAEGAKVTITMEPTTPGQQTAAKLTGTLPPDFTARLFGSEKTFSLSEQWGKVVAIDFWATWCGPCLQVMPEMKKIYEEYKNRDDVVFITISLDNSDNKERLRDMIKDKDLRFPIMYSGKGWEDEAARAFGVRGIPSSFVIGRNGRFAAERLPGSKLAAAIKDAVDKPIDPAFAGKKPARLTVKVGLDVEGQGLPGVTLSLKATAADGKTILEENLPLPGQATQIVWPYPALAPGGRVIASARAEGLPQQTQTREDPGRKAVVRFLFKSPRQITGRIATDGGKTPATGIKVTAYRDNGFRRSATTDEKGHFHIPVLPGTYTIRTEGNEQFCPVASERLTTVVSKSANPTPLALEACRAVALQGVVKDESGKPVAGANVLSPTRQSVKTDEKGRFTLPGMPSAGTATVYARKNNKSGLVQLKDTDSRRDVEIRLGQGSRSRDGLGAGRVVPALAARSLKDGKPVDWKPAPDRNTLVVFCALWHPQGNALLQQAISWAKANDAHLAAFSIDWSLKQAQRHQAAFGSDTTILYAGAGGLSAAADWHFTVPGQVILVSPKATVLSVPSPLQLP